MDFTRKLANYADVLVQVGLRCGPGDRIVIRAGIDAAPLVRLVAERAYSAGAHNVDVMWADDAVRLARFAKGTPEAAGELPYDAVLYQRIAARGDSVLAIDTSDPELMAAIDPVVLSEYQQVFSEATADYRKRAAAMELIWCSAAAPSPAWAHRVFPDVETDTAVERLWEAVFATCRADQPDPIAAWDVHLAALAARCSYLDERGFDRLRYRGPGTDFIVGLPKGHRWVAGDGGLRNTVPNLPTEEVFTSPDRMRAEGVVRTTKPLSYLGTIIDGFSFRFEEGKVVAGKAERGQEALDQLLQTDAGAQRLGEAALVPQSSAVAAQSLVWSNTLYDENDASHLALGRAYPICIEGGVGLSPDERLEAGLNHSNIHVDFVVGSTDLDVFGVLTDDTEHPLMSNGEWAFEV